MQCELLVKMLNYYKHALLEVWSVAKTELKEQVTC